MRLSRRKSASRWRIAAQVGLGLGELVAGEAHRVLARLVGQPVHQRAGMRRGSRWRSSRASSGVKALARTWMMPPPES